MSQAVQPQVNGLAVSEANPLPVAVVSGGGGGGGGGGGSVTAAGVNGTLAQAVQGINGGVPVNITGFDANGNKLLVGTARDRFFENFHGFDTSPSGDWELVQTGPGMTITGPLGGAAAGSGPYLNINSGTQVGKTIILSRSTFSAPVDLRYQISASQRIANNRFIIGFVQVDEAGNIVTDTALTTAPDIQNARNAVFHQHDGIDPVIAQLRVRAAGSAIDTVANNFGAGFTTVATGSSPNFIAATTYGLMMERDKINTRAWGQNILTNTGGQFSYDRLMINPTRMYKLIIIVENNGVPASATAWRLHLVNVLDATRFDVSPRSAGITDQSKAFPVVATVIGGTLPTVTTVTTVSTVTAVTNAGTPAAPATPFILNSAASTNEQLILTGTSGLYAFYATNTGASVAFVKLYNKATAPVSTDVPAMIIPVPAAVSGVPGVATLPIGFNGFRFALGLGIRITGGVADNDTTAVAAGQVKVMLSRTV